MGLSKLLALLLVPVYILTITILYLLNISYVFEPGFLLPVTNTLFAGLLPVVIAYIAARVYLVTGSSSIMFMGCGMLTFGLAAISAGWLIGVSGGPNINVTIYNTGALVGSSFHTIGALLYLRGPTSPSYPKRGKLKTVASYGGVLGFMALFSLIAAYDFVPPFFIQEIGPTALRQVVLGTAVFLYILSSVFFMFEYLKWKFDFFFWYSLSLVLLAIGLFAFFVQSAVGSPLGWVGRSANYFGGVFSLIAVLRAVRVARSKSLPLEESIAIFFSDAESSYRTLVEAASDAIISFDQEDRVIGWNASAANMFGYSKGEAAGSSFFELVMPETYVGVLKKDIELVIARSNTLPLPSPLEIQGKRSDGSLFPVEVSVSVRDLPTGRVSTCIVRDITERKQNEDRIRRLNETLELRVAQRTAELEASYQTIREEVDLHKRTAEDLRQVSLRLQFHMGNTPLAVVEWDHNYRVTAWTKSAQRIFGWASYEVIGKRIDELGIVYEEDWSKVQESMTTMDNVTCSSNISHIRNYHKDGSVIFCEWYNSSLSDESVDRRSVLSLVLDVTERQRSEESLKQSEELFRDVFRYAPVGMVLTATDGKLHKVNNSFSSMLGYTEKDLLGADYRAITYPDDLDVSNAQVISILSGKKESAYFEKRYVHKNGNIVWTLVSTFLIRDTDGNAKHFVTLVQDITDRKGVEEALRRQAERLRNLYEAADSIMRAIESPESIAHTALEHICRLLSCHRASIGIFDFEKKEVGVFAAKVDVETIVQVGEKLSEEAYGDLEILRRGTMEIVEDMSMAKWPPTVIRILMAEGVRSCINVPLLSGKELVGALNIGWENPRVFSAEETEIASEVASQIAIAIEHERLRKEMERYTEELEERVRERTAQLEAANKELESFSYSVSHDLRAPLRAVDGYTRILLEEYEPHLDAEGKRVCSVISESARTMGKLIDDLLALSRIGRTDMQPSRIDMATLAKSIFFELTTPEDQERIDFRVGPLPRVWGDPTLVRQVWMNLLGNAVKFSSKKDRAMIEVSGEQQGDEIVYSIRDNGAGFEMQYVNKLFGVFQRLHSTREFEGTGVGLAIVQRIVHRHGGRVWAEGETGKGASFHFTMKKGD